MTMRRVLDVRDLPEGALDNRSPIWWGNLLLLLIETTLFALLFAAYLYVRKNFREWPPTHIDGPVADFAPYPDLLLPTLSLVVLLAGILPMYRADRAALRMDARSVRNAVAAAVPLGLLAIGIRFFEFSSLHFLWNENAYASVAWMLLGMHLAHQIVITTEDIFMLAWIQFREMDHSHARDVRVTAVYWYWVAGIYVPLYLLVYWGPRIL